MIQAISTSRWLQAQEAERYAASYSHKDCLKSAQHIFQYLSIPFEQSGKTIIEVGSGPFPASGFCNSSTRILFEPIWFAELEEATKNPDTKWYRQALEDVEVLPNADEAFLFNCLQHVRDPEVVVERCKQMAPVVRFFEPVDYPTCVYHPHTFTQDDFVRWFGDSVKRYTDRLPGFFDDDCCYGTWRKR